MNANVLLIDLGSTNTKLVAVDINRKMIVATAKAFTTVGTDVTIGLENALAALRSQIGDIGRAEMIACSSAAGGLRMVSVGLVPQLSSEAARRAALGAGAKIVGHFSNRLTPAEMEKILGLRPDIILLAGGTDGGNENVIIHNAGLLARACLSAPIVVAGNKCAGDEIARLLKAGGKNFHLVDNVMPEIGRLEVEPCRNAIRNVFIENIVHAKGLDKAKKLVGNIIMATPVAVLNAVTILSTGYHGEAGVGDLIVADVGGATTDIYSIAKGAPAGGAVSVRGLPEPFAKRTVEGDLGVRHNIDTLIELCRGHGLEPDDDILAAFRADPGRVPMNEREMRVDTELARMAVETSFERHVGKLETVYGPHGEMLVQTGKDLSQVTKIIGTGGPIIYSSRPGMVLGSILANTGDRSFLKPVRAELYLDEQYIMYAMGLLAQSEPKIALTIMKNGMKQL